MDWISKLERKYGRYAIPNIMKYIVILQIAGFVISTISPAFMSNFLIMDARAMLRGQIWRAVTFLMTPASGGVFMLMITLYLYYMIGQSLENYWGAFRFNLYLISGILFHILAALLIYFIFRIPYPLGTEYLYLSLFFAFATQFPNMEFLLFFILPVKAKYLGMLNGVFFAYTILQGFLPAYSGGFLGIIYKSNAIAAFVSILNFLIFYFTSRNFKQHSPKEMRRRAKFKQSMQQAQRPVNHYANGAKHKCAVCGRTELDDPTLEFRYCSKCKGNYEYCQDHLFTHEHIQ